MFPCTDQPKPRTYTGVPFIYVFILLKSAFTDFYPSGIKIPLEYRISYFLQIGYEY